MAIKNAALTVNFFVWDTANNIGRTGDASNLTMRLVKDGGTPATLTNAISEPDSTNMPGVYEVALTASEMNADFIALAGKSSTADTVVIPLTIATEQGKVGDVETDTQDIQSRIPSALVGGRVDATLGGSLSTGAVDQVNGAADTALSDIGLDHLVAGSVAGADVADNSIVAKLAAGGATADWDTFDPALGGPTRALHQLGESQIEGDGVASAVWGAARSGYASTGTFGEGVASVQGAVTGSLGSLSTGAADQVNAAADTALADYDPPTKAELDSGLAGLNDPAADAIADAVWDEALSGHTSTGTAGERVGRVPNAAAGGNGGLPTVDANNRVAGVQGTKNTFDDLTDLTAAAAADAVWDEATSGHESTGTFGELNRGIVYGQCITGTLTTTTATTNLTETTDDHYNGRTLIFIGGALDGQGTAISDYAGSNKLLTFTAITEAPANGQRFKIV